MTPCPYNLGGIIAREVSRAISRKHRGMNRLVAKTTPILISKQPLVTYENKFG